MRKSNVTIDSMALILVKMLTMVMVIVSTMILSRTLSLTQYGTYSSGNIMINTTTSLSALGLLDAVNYYYNGKWIEEREDYINTVFAIIIGFGLFFAVMLFAFRGSIADYFHNPALLVIFPYIIFRPLIANLGGALQNLQVSIGKARIVAVRNSIISVSKLLAIIFTALYSKDIRTVFICMLVVEFLSLIFYYQILYKNKVRIAIHRMRMSKVREILAYCIPMGIYIQMNVLSRNLDKLVIGHFEDTEKLGVFTNCANKLPFDVISAALLTVLVPILTRCIRNDDFENGADLFRGNLKIGYTFTFTLGVTVMCLARPAVLFLYGEKYLSGITIFMLYILVDMVNFISFSLVLAAKGKTRILMMVSCLALCLNLIANFVFYGIFGFVGPAMATVLVTIISNLILLILSARVLHTRLWKLFEARHLCKLGLELSVMAVVITILRGFMESHNVHYAIILVILGVLGAGSVTLLNLGEIKKTFSSLNRIGDKSQQTVT